MRTRSWIIGRFEAKRLGGRLSRFRDISAAYSRFRSLVRCAIIIVIAHLLLAEIAPEIPPLETRAMTAASDPQIVPRPPAAAPALCAADRGVADALTSVLSDHTRRVYGAQWRLFNEWCGGVDLRALPAEPLTVARYLAVRAGSGASIATLRLASSAIAKVHEWAGHDSPGRDRGVREALKGWGRRLGRSLAGKPLAEFPTTTGRRITVVYGMIVYAIRFNNPLLHR